MRKLMFMITKAPYGTMSAGEGFRAAIAFAGMDIDTTIVLIDDGVFSALMEQKAGAIGMKSLAEAIESAREYGARTLVHAESLARRGIERHELVDIETIDTQGLADLIRETDATIKF